MFSVAPADPVRVEPWPTERPLHVLAVIVSTLVWILLTVSIIGLVYALLIGAFFFIGHLTLIAHVRGSAVRLGPDQFPQWHEMVARLSRRLELRRIPEAYVMQGGGMLNAFATRFLAADIVILYSDLLEACGDNDAACEMIVGHELAHVKRGHLRWHWFLLPSFLVPFLGTTLSRAREYTCDRYGFALARDRDAALVGLTILAVGGRYGTAVNREALAQQRVALNTGLMVLAEWLSTHPPLAKRLVQLNPTLASERTSTTTGHVRALAIVGGILISFAVVGATAAVVVPRLARASAALQQQAAPPRVDYKYEPPPLEVARAQVDGDFKRLAMFLRGELDAGRSLPEDPEGLYKRWGQVRPYDDSPFDPFDGERYGYTAEGADYSLWSSGPDGKTSTADDLVYDSRGEIRSVGR